MVAINETAYPRFKYNATKPETRAVYTPNEQEQHWMRARRVNPQLQQVYIVYLKCFQRLGYFPKFSNIPNSIIEHIAETLDRKPVSASYGEAVPGTTLRRIKTTVRRRCHVKRFTLKTHGQWLREFAFDIARTKESVLDIVNALIEFLVKESYELPAFSTLDRLSYEARAAANNLYIDRIFHALSPQSIQLLQSVLSESDDSGTTLWHKLKEEPKRPSVKNFTIFYQHSKWVRRLSDAIGPLPELPEAKRYQLVIEAKAYTRDKINSIQRRKRIALAALLINEQAYYSTDCLVGLFIREIRQLHNRARADLADFQKASINESEKLITMLFDVATARSQNVALEVQIQQIDRALQNDPENVALRCDRLVHHGLASHLPFLKRRYSGQRRRILLNCLELLKIDHTAHGGDLLACLDMIVQCKDKNLATLAVIAIDSPQGDDRTAIDWIGQRWSSVLYKDQSPNKINRMMDAKVFEIAVLSEVSKRFQSGDLFVDNSTMYDDYRKHLITWDQYNDSVAEYVKEIGLSRSPLAFTKQLKQRFQLTARRADRRILKGGFVEIASVHLHLRRSKAEQRSAAMDRFDAAITDALPQVSILDLLTETAEWVNLPRSFKPVSGHQTKIDDYMKRLVITLFCYGCNVGPVQTARSIKGISRKQVAYLNLAHTREKDLIEATRLVTNAYNKFELPSYWGTGTTASVDGTRFDMYEQNLLSEYHVRYGSYGGVGYYLVSDKYIALFSRFIPCGVREAMYLIDALMENESQISPTTIHGDTHAQSTIIFGLCHLLGIKLMPRIKDINRLIFFKPDGRARYIHIENLFTESINFNVIKSNYADMLRVAMSIKEGKVNASTIVRRLGERGIRNSLYYAFRELGRVIRTQYLLEYLTDIKMRETILAATCKSEAFNDFVQWIFFYNNGEIQENLRHEQSKMIKYNHLVANLVILHNVNNMTKVINKLRKEGMEITDEMLSGTAPYRRGHIDLLGEYHLKIKKKALPTVTSTVINQRPATQSGCFYMNRGRPPVPQTSPVGLVDGLCRPLPR